MGNGREGWSHVNKLPPHRPRELFRSCCLRSPTQVIRCLLMTSYLPEGLSCVVPPLILPICLWVTWGLLPNPD